MHAERVSPARNVGFRVERGCDRRSVGAAGGWRPAGVAEVGGWLVVVGSQAGLRGLMGKLQAGPVQVLGHGGGLT